MTYFVAATADEYELPVCVADRQAELARYLGVDSATVCHGLKRSRNGKTYCHGIRKGLMYYRMDADTGEILTGG